MKIIGIKIESNYEKKLTLSLPIIVECTGLEVDSRSGRSYEFDLNDCRITLHSAHPSVSYFIIKTETYDDGTAFKPYRGLNKTDVEAIMGSAEESDVIDLRKIGNYQICSTRELQTVLVDNTSDVFTDDYAPLLVKIVDNNEE